MKEPIMNMSQLPRAFRRSSQRRLGSTLIALSAVVVLCQAPAAHSQSFVASDPAVYRCAVLGELGFCRQQQDRPSEWIEEWVELGVKAKEFRHRGAGTAEAIARARALGEEPIRHVDRVISVPLSDKEKYERGTSQRVIPSERRESLSVAPACEKAPNLHVDSGVRFSDLAGALRAADGDRKCAIEGVAKHGPSV